LEQKLRQCKANHPFKQYRRWLYFLTSALSEKVSASCYTVSNTSWVETTITWNNKPALGAILNSFTVNATAYVQSEKAAGRNVLTLGMHNAATSSVYVRANSRNATSNKPELVIVTNAAPTVSISSPANGAVFTAPASISLTANAADSDGSIAKVEYFNGTMLIGSATTSPFTLNWPNVAVGNYTVTAKATDNSGAATTSTAVNIILNTPPSVSLTAPVEGSMYNAPATVLVSANATDSDGTISKVDFYNDTTLIGTETSAPYTLSWNSVAAGSYALTAKATDNSGASTASGAVSISVNAAQVHGVFYIHADHLNTPRMISDSSKKVVWSWESDPFGSTAPNEDVDGDGVGFVYNARFAGQYFDGETGLYYNYFRDYDPKIGRYLETDPI